MSRFSGKQFKGAAKAAREVRKQEAEERNTRTTPDRRKSARRG